MEIFECTKRLTDSLDTGISSIVVVFKGDKLYIDQNSNEFTTKTPTTQLLI